MKKTILAAGLMLAMATTTAGQAPSVTEQGKVRAAALVAQMTLDEKIDLISGKVDTGENDENKRSVTFGHHFRILFNSPHNYIGQSMPSVI